MSTFLWIVTFVSTLECKSQSVMFQNITDAISLPAYTTEEPESACTTIYKDLSSSINYVWYTQITGNNGSWVYQYLSNVYDIYGQQYNASNTIKSSLPISLINGLPDNNDCFTTISPKTNDIITCYDDIWPNQTYKCRIYLNQKQVMLSPQIITTDLCTTLPQVLSMDEAYLIFWISCNNHTRIMYDLWDLNGINMKKSVMLLDISTYITYDMPDTWKVTEKDKNFVILFEADHDEHSESIEFISGFYTNLTASSPAQIRLISPLSNTDMTPNLHYRIFDVASLHVSTECCIVSLYNYYLDSDYDEINWTYMSLSDIFGNNVFGDEDIFITNSTSGRESIKVLRLSETIPSLFGVTYPIVYNNETDYKSSDYKLMIQVYQLNDKNGQISLSKIGYPQKILDTKFGGVLRGVVPQIVLNSNIHGETSLFITWYKCCPVTVTPMTQSWNVSISDQTH